MLRGQKVLEREMTRAKLMSQKGHMGLLAQPKHHLRVISKMPTRSGPITLHVMRWEPVISSYKLVYLEWINNKAPPLLAFTCFSCNVDSSPPSESSNPHVMLGTGLERSNSPQILEATGRVPQHSEHAPGHSGVQAVGAQVQVGQVPVTTKQKAKLPQTLHGGHGLPAVERRKDGALERRPISLRAFHSFSWAT